MKDNTGCPERESSLEAREGFSEEIKFKRKSE